MLKLTTLNGAPLEGVAIIEYKGAKEGVEIRLNTENGEVDVFTNNVHDGDYSSLWEAYESIKEGE